MRPFRTFHFGKIRHTVEREQKRRIIWKTQDKGPVMALREKCVNVIASRVIQNNISGSVRIALELAARAEKDVEKWMTIDEEGNPVETIEKPLQKMRSKKVTDDVPVRKVMYVNSYASLENLRTQMEYYAEGLDCIKERKVWAGEGQDELSGLPILYTEGEMGLLVTGRDKVRQLIKENEVDVLILNSLEYAQTSAYEKRKLVSLLQEWQREFDMTVIVYTTEVRKGMRAGVTAHGPIGQLVGSAGSFWYMSDERTEIYPYVEPDVAKESENEFRTKHNYKNGQTRPVPTTTIKDEWERTLNLLAKGDKRTWEEEKELSPFTCAAMEERMTEEEKRNLGIKV